MNNESKILNEQIQELLTKKPIDKTSVLLSFTTWTTFYRLGIILQEADVLCSHDVLQWAYISRDGTHFVDGFFSGGTTKLGISSHSIKYFEGDKADRYRTYKFVSFYDFPESYTSAYGDDMEFVTVGVPEKGEWVLFEDNDEVKQAHEGIEKVCAIYKIKDNPNVGCGDCSWSGKKSELGLTDFKVDGEHQSICPECGSSDIH